MNINSFSKPYAGSPVKSLPPGANPETYGIESMTALLKRAAYFPIFSVHDPGRPNMPLPSPNKPGALIGVDVNEELHRFDVRAELAPSIGCPPISKRVGEPVANVSIRWLVIPDDFVAAPDRIPPPTELDPTRSQRFAMLNGHMTFKDEKQSGFRAFGTGRTFPALVEGRPQLRIGAVINVLEGFGAFRALPGTVVVNGYIQPPYGLDLNFVIRFADPDSKLLAGSRITPIQPIADPDPETAFLVLLGEPDPTRPTTLNQAPNGTVLGSNVFERLRLVRLNFDVGTRRGPRSRVSEGALVGTLSGTLSFNPMDPRAVSPIQTTNGVFTFYDRNGCAFGVLRANIVEGRAFPTPLGGRPVWRFGGVGPFLGGTGPFQDAVGMISLNAAVSVFPRTLSNLYVLRVSDPDGRFRASFARAWS